MTKIALKNGGSFEVVQDEDPQNPREKHENLGVMVCFHDRYNLGDGRAYTPYEYKGQGWESLRKQLETDHDVAVILPLFLFDHSGITMRTSSDQFKACDGAGWDWGQVGWIFVTKQTVVECYKSGAFSEEPELTDELIERAQAALVAEVEIYDQYLRGDIYGFVVREPPCEKCGSKGEVGDSCWGFFGSNVKENGMLDHLDTETREQVLAAL